MAHENFFRRRVAAQPERRVNLRYGIVPSELAFVGQFRQQQRRHTLGVGGDHEQRIGVDWRGLAQFAHAEAAFEDDLAAIDERDRTSRHAQLLHRRLHERLQRRDPRRIKRMRRFAGE